MFNRDNYTTADFQGHNRFCKGNFKQKFEKFQQHFFDDSDSSTDFKKRAHVPVNITESDEFYQVQLFAAGRRKEDFKISIDKQILTISGLAQEADATANYIHQEQPNASFERAFQLQDDILTERVHASYDDGVLTIILQKDLDRVKSAHQITVS
ncbi:Hsp20/alpha crystallin family protein [Sphingobacterium shayense]|uniref:Hsp20/alpha crystallin family protein n=1 Tax=Sphingobacterium shayense TaxID=626343 RepID=UPI0015530782|nr:Hsp20/alpha crystallin family protein [Sphingobacterium shayense]NQD72322.1 Hsp20/alpha crystallin family protein [Sphingobacterium shayense]